MENLIINVAVMDGGYSAACDKIPGWVVAYTGDLDGFKQYLVESIDFWIEGVREDGLPYDKIFDGKYELVYKWDIQSLLLHYQGIFSFSALQTITGINQKQLCHYAAGRSKPRVQQAEKIEAGLHTLAKELLTISV
ncbi:MAG: hypothetical protein RR206_04855 [Bacteroidaceae bacterium]